MARKIIWSQRAQADRKAIYQYWNKRNKSKNYSRKLNVLYSEAAELISIHPQTGRVTERQGIRVKLISHFALIYEFSDSELLILTIFDTRLNPVKIDKLIEE